MDPPGWVQRQRHSSTALASSDETNTDMEFYAPYQVSPSRAAPSSASVGSWGYGSDHGSQGSMTSLANRRGSARFSSSLSRRNSTVWLASMSMDVAQIHHSSMNLPELWEPEAVRKSPFDKLPFELITLILQYVAIDENGPSNLYKMLSTCGRIYDVGVATLYRHVIFRYPHTFDKFRWSIEATGYGQHVRVLDFSAFTSVGLGRTIRMNMEIQMVSHLSIYRILELCPGICEFLAGEAIDIDMSPEVIDKLLTLPVLNTIDFCGANNPTFVQAMSHSLLMVPDFALYNLSKLSLHCCNTLPSHVLEQIVKKLVKVTRLDLTQTLLGSKGLLGLPRTAKLTHLSLARCQQLSAEAIVEFLSEHPATKKLEWLSLMYENAKPNPFDAESLEQVLAALPPTLTHLNLNGLKLTEKHLKMLKVWNLRSLCISFADVSKTFLQTFLAQCPNLRFVDLCGIQGINKWTLMAGDVLNWNPHIEMFEFSIEIVTGLNGVTVPGFIVNPGRGRRGWIHRQKQVVPIHRDPSIHTTAPFSFTQIAKQRMMRASGATEAKVDVLPTKPPPAGDPVWRFASHKVNVSQIGIGGVPTPAIYGHEGLYNYYSLNSI